MYLDISLPGILLGLLFLLTPVWTSILVGCISGWFFPQLLVFLGGYIGGVIGIVALGLQIWITTAWFDVSRLSIPMTTSVTFGTVVTLGVCWWLDRREKAHLKREESRAQT